MAKLTPKQELFCKEYLIDLNATQAAIRAGYSQDTASIIGYENLRKPNLVDLIAQLKAERSERTEITSDYALKLLKQNADITSQLIPAYSLIGKGKNIQKVPIENKDGEQLYTILDANASNKTIDMMLRHLGEYNDSMTMKNDYDEMNPEQVKAVFITFCQKLGLSENLIDQINQEISY